MFWDCLSAPWNLKLIVKLVIKAVTIFFQKEHKSITVYHEGIPSYRCFGVLTACWGKVALPTTLLCTLLVVFSHNLAAAVSPASPITYTLRELPPQLLHKTKSTTKAGHLSQKSRLPKFLPKHHIVSEKCPKMTEFLLLLLFFFSFSAAFLSAP